MLNIERFRKVNVSCPSHSQRNKMSVTVPRQYGTKVHRCADTNHRCLPRHIGSGLHFHGPLNIDGKTITDWRTVLNCLSGCHGVKKYITLYTFHFPSSRRVLQAALTNKQWGEH